MGVPPAGAGPLRVSTTSTSSPRRMGSRAGRRRIATGGLMVRLAARLSCPMVTRTRRRTWEATGVVPISTLTSCWPGWMRALAGMVTTPGGTSPSRAICTSTPAWLGTLRRTVRRGRVAVPPTTSGGVMVTFSSSARGKSQNQRSKSPPRRPSPLGKADPVRSRPGMPKLSPSR